MNLLVRCHVIPIGGAGNFCIFSKKRRMTRDVSFCQYRCTLKENKVLQGLGEQQNRNAGMACSSFYECLIF